LNKIDLLLENKIDPDFEQNEYYFGCAGVYDWDKK
jgi:hypothetical protein